MKFYIAPAYRIPLAIAITLHFALLVLLLVLPSQHQATSLSASAPVVHANVISQAKINHEVTKIKAQQHHQHQLEQARLRRLQAQASAAKNQRLKEQRRLAKLTQQRFAQAKHLRELRVAKQRLANKIKAEQRQQAVAKRQAVIAAKKRAALQRQKREQELQKLAKEQQRLQQKLLQQQLAADHAAINSVQSQHVATLVSRYTAAIKHAVRVHWLKPQGLQTEKIATEFYLTVAPDGTVIHVKVVRSSGNSAFDQSAVTAINQASPLPVPKDAAAFAKFRQFYFTFYANPAATK